MVNVPHDVTIDGLRQAYRETMAKHRDASRNHLKVIKEPFEALLRLLQDDAQESDRSEDDDDGYEQDVLDELNHYADILQVGADVTREGLKKAYHAAILRCHPDKEGGSKEAAQDVVQAYQVMLEYLEAGGDEAEQAAGDEAEDDDVQEALRALPHPRPHACDSCGKSFTLKCNLKRHQAVHTGARPFECRRCGKAYTRRHYLKEHEKVHLARERSFKCTVGDYDSAFFKKMHLELHMRLKHIAKSFPCGHCGCLFAVQAHLVRHESVHDRRLHRFECDACTATFAQSYELALHKRTVHESTGPTVVCATCERAFARDSDLKAHVKKQHT
ncbi:zinc finger protein [Aphelenchoides avenae]|nr:zinc finger protein [Aphelenchus avenae]